ncbi:beta strand repeat-containing protein [Roseibium salinum]|uniref:beta strand repeat-containing protein n=1 Tax=Roseibium salinum TaxID=1604349 RepID=UPI003615DBF3
MRAEIGNHADVFASGDVIVSATSDTILRSIVFAGAGTVGSTAFGGAITVPIQTDKTIAEVMADSSVNAGGDIVVSARHNLRTTILDAAVGISGQAAGTASIAIIVQTSDVKAKIGERAQLTATDTVLIEAVGTAQMQSLDGGVAVGSSAGVGGSGFLLVRNDTVKALVGAGAVVTGKASGGDGRKRTNQWGMEEEDPVSGVAILAESREALVGVAVQGSVSTSSFAFAGSLPVTVINETTVAKIDKDASINTEGEEGDPQDLRLRAVDDTLIVNVAGNLAVGSGAAVGIGADIAAITKKTKAIIKDASVVAPDPDTGLRPDDAPGIFAKRNIIIEADANDKLVSVVIGVSASGTAAIGINANIYVLTATTKSVIGDNAYVFANGSIVVDAAHYTDADLIVLSAAGGGAAAVNGGVGVAVFNKTVRAKIEEGAIVTALGEGDGLKNIRNGTIESSLTSADSISQPGLGNGGISPGFGLSDVSDGSIDFGLKDISDLDTDDQTEGRKLFEGKDYGARRIGENEEFHGLSVTATNVDDITAVGGAISGGGTAAVGGSVVVTVVTSSAKALVKSGAQINTIDRENADGRQSVQIAAGNVFDNLGIVLAGGGSGGVAIMPIAHFAFANLTTTAKIDSARVNAERNIVVRADAREDVQSLELLIAGSPYASVAPAISVVDVTSDTQAKIVGASVVDSAGNVEVRANDSTEVDTLGIALAGGAGALGAVFTGASVDKSTEAIIGDGATVSARANGEAMTVLSGEGVEASDTEAQKGLAVEARSSETMNLVAFGAAGGGLAIGGSMMVQYIDSDTFARIEDGAIINPNAAPGLEVGDEQSVSVNARNAVDLFVVGGGVAVGGVAGAAGVTITDLHNDTTAMLGGNVSARDKVSVAALSEQAIEGTVFSGAAGAGGLAAAVGVFSLGGDLEFSYSYTREDPNSSSSGRQQHTSTPFAPGTDPQNDTQTLVNNTLDGLLINLAGSGEGTPGGEAVGDANATVSQNSGAGAPPPPSAETDTVADGTTALISAGSVVKAGGAIDIDARQDVDFNVIAGGTAVGLIGASGGIAVVSVDNDVTARIGDVSILSAGGDISLTAVSDQTFELTSFAGSGALLAALSAGVAHVTDTSSTRALIDDGVHILTANEIFVTADSKISLYGESIGISLAAGVAGSAAVTHLKSSGETEASAGENVIIGTKAAELAEGEAASVGSLVLKAKSQLFINDPLNGGTGAGTGVMAIGGSVGILAGTAGVAEAYDLRSTEAFIGAGSYVTVREKVEVVADSSSDISVRAQGGAGGLVAVGVMIGKAVVESSTSAEIRGSKLKRTRIAALGTEDVAGTVKVSSTAKANVFAETITGSVGILGGRGSSSEAYVTAKSRGDRRKYGYLCGRRDYRQRCGHVGGRHPGQGRRSRARRCRLYICDHPDQSGSRVFFRLFGFRCRDRSDHVGRARIPDRHGSRIHAIREAGENLLHHSRG